MSLAIVEAGNREAANATKHARGRTELLEGLQDEGGFTPGEGEPEEHGLGQRFGQEAEAV